MWGGRGSAIFFYYLLLIYAKKLLLLIYVTVLKRVPTQIIERVMLLHTKPLNTGYTQRRNARVNRVMFNERLSILVPYLLLV